MQHAGLTERARHATAGAVLSAASGLVWTAWSIVCAVTYVSSDDQVVGGVTFDPEPTGPVVFAFALAAGLGLAPALLGLSRWRGVRLGSMPGSWGSVALIFLVWSLVVGLDGGAFLPGFWLSLVTGLSAGFVAISLQRRQADRPSTE